MATARARLEALRESEQKFDELMSDKDFSRWIDKEIHNAQCELDRIKESKGGQQ
jgi:hypothetical protein